MPNLADLGQELAVLQVDLVELSLVVKTSVVFVGESAEGKSKLPVLLNLKTPSNYFKLKESSEHVINL